MTSFILLLNIVMLITIIVIIIIIIDKTHNIYDLIYTVSTYMILQISPWWWNIFMICLWIIYAAEKIYGQFMNILWTRICFDLLKITETRRLKVKRLIQNQNQIFLIFRYQILTLLLLNLNLNLDLNLILAQCS